MSPHHVLQMCKPKSYISLAIALLTIGMVLPVSMSEAQAYPARSVTSLNVRSGPGVKFRKIGALAPGEFVDVMRCIGNGWCEVVYRRSGGWVSGRYLDRDEPRRAPPVVIHEERPPVEPGGFGTVLPLGGPFRDGPGHHRRPRP